MTTPRRLLFVDLAPIPAPIGSSPNWAGSARIANCWRRDRLSRRSRVRRSGASAGRIRRRGVALLATRASLEAAARAARPDRIVPLDELAARALRDRRLHLRAGPDLRELIEASLGAPEHFDAACSRQRLAALAATLGIRAPRAFAVPDLATARRAAARLGYPVVLKREQTAGGAARDLPRRGRARARVPARLDPRARQGRARLPPRLPARRPGAAGAAALRRRRTRVSRLVLRGGRRARGRRLRRRAARSRRHRLERLYQGLRQRRDGRGDARGDRRAPMLRPRLAGFPRRRPRRGASAGAQSQADRLRASRALFGHDVLSAMLGREPAPPPRGRREPSRSIRRRSIATANAASPGRTCCTTPPATIPRSWRPMRAGSTAAIPSGGVRRPRPPRSVARLMAARQRHERDDLAAENVGARDRRSRRRRRSS